MDKTVAYLQYFTHLWPRLPRKWCAQLHIAHTQAMEISCHFHLSDEASRGCWPIQMKDYKWKTSIIVTQGPFFIGFSRIPTHSRTATMRTHAMHTPYDPLYIGLHINLCIPFAAKKDASWQHHETYELPFCCKQSCPYLQPPTYNILESFTSSFFQAGLLGYRKRAHCCTEWLKPGCPQYSHQRYSVTANRWCIHSGTTTATKCHEQLYGMELLQQQFVSSE